MDHNFASSDIFRWNLKRSFRNAEGVEPSELLIASRSLSWSAMTLAALFLFIFGLRQMAVEAGGKSPKSKDFVELIRRLREENAAKIFVQPQFSRSAAEKIALELNLNIEVHSPLEEDPLENIETLTEALTR